MDFIFQVAPTATLDNNTSLGFNVGGKVSALSVEAGYDFEIWEDSTTLGPLFTVGASTPLGSVSVYDHSFALHYTPTDYVFAA